MQNNRLAHFFKNFTNSIKENSELNFRNLWHPESFSKNLTGSGGLSGDAVFTQAVNGKWTLRPELDQLEILENPMAYFMPCEVVSTEPSARVLDRVYVLIGQDKSNMELWLLGASEDKEEVLNLWQRLSENELAPGLETKDKEPSTEDLLPLISTEEAALELINKMNEALDQKDESSFAQQWLSKGYKHNLAGKGGLPGQEFFTQLQETQSSIKALLEYATLFEEPEGILIPIQLWLNHLNLAKANDERLLLLVNHQQSLKALGVGSDLTEVRHLYLSYKANLT